MSRAPIVTRRDLEGYLEDVGLTLVELDESDPPTVRATVRGAPTPREGLVIRRPPVDERVAELRRALRERGVVGVRWVVQLVGDGPYRTAGSGG